MLLRAQDAWIEDLNGDFVYGPDEDGNLQVTAESREQAAKLGETLEESTYELLHSLGLNGQYAPERTAEIEALGSCVSSTYPPVPTTPLAYVPQAIGISPVSYTHLDVYKRQVEDRAGGGFQNAGRRGLAFRCFCCQPLPE